MSSLNLKFNIADGSASVILAVLVTYLSIYLHIALYHDVHVLSIPIVCLIILLSAMFGAVQVVIHPSSCSNCGYPYRSYDNEEDEEEDAEEEEEEEEAEEEVEEEKLSPTNSVSNLVEEDKSARSIQQLREYAAGIVEKNRKKRARYESDLSGSEATVFNPEESDFKEPVLNPEDLLEQPRPSVEATESSS
jgi:hypothetical protein